MVYVWMRRTIWHFAFCSCRQLQLLYLKLMQQWYINMIWKYTSTFSAMFVYLVSFSYVTVDLKNIHACTHTKFVVHTPLNDNARKSAALKCKILLLH